MPIVIQLTNHGRPPRDSRLGERLFIKSYLMDSYLARGKKKKKKKVIGLASHNPTPCRYSSPPRGDNSHQSVQQRGFKRKEPHIGSDWHAYGVCQRAAATVLLVDRGTSPPRIQKRMTKEKKGQAFLPLSPTLALQQAAAGLSPS